MKSTASAGCLSSIRETTNTTENYYVCQSDNAMDYHYAEVRFANGFIETFSFDRGGLNLICSASRMGDVEVRKCNKYAAKLPKLSIEERGNTKISISDIASFDQLQFNSKKSTTMFQYPDEYILINKVGCFVSVGADYKDIQIIYNREKPHKLSNCLLAVERFEDRD